LGQPYCETSFTAAFAKKYWFSSPICTLLLGAPSWAGLWACMPLLWQHGLCHHLWMNCGAIICSLKIANNPLRASFNRQSAWETRQRVQSFWPLAWGSEDVRRRPCWSVRKNSHVQLQAQLWVWCWRPACFINHTRRGDRYMHVHLSSIHSSNRAGYSQIEVFEGTKLGVISVLWLYCYHFRYFVAIYKCFDVLCGCNDGSGLEPSSYIFSPKCIRLGVCHLSHSVVLQVNEQKQIVQISDGLINDEDNNWSAVWTRPTRAARRHYCAPGFKRSPGIK